MSIALLLVGCSSSSEGDSPCAKQLWTSAGCGVEPTCVNPPFDACAEAVEYCGCDGRTVLGDCGGAPAPYRFVGRCESADTGIGDAASDACEARMWTAPGCSVSPTCMTLPLDACAAIIDYCACDGRTITGACGMAPAPWKFVGRCDALDAGPD